MAHSPVEETLEKTLEETIFFHTSDAGGERLFRMLQQPYGGQVRRAALCEIRRIGIVLCDNPHEERYEEAAQSLHRRVSPHTSAARYEESLREYLSYLMATVQPTADELRQW